MNTNTFLQAVDACVFLSEEQKQQLYTVAPSLPAEAYDGLLIELKRSAEERTDVFVKAGAAIEDTMRHINRGAVKREELEEQKQALSQLPSFDE